MLYLDYYCCCDYCLASIRSASIFYISLLSSSLSLETAFSNSLTFMLALNCKAEVLPVIVADYRILLLLDAIDDISLLPPALNYVVVCLIELGFSRSLVEASRLSILVFVPVSPARLSMSSSELELWAASNLLTRSAFDVPIFYFAV